MTDEELKAIEAESVGDCSNCMLLVAEVRRLKALVKKAEWSAGLEFGMTDAGCPWCESEQGEPHCDECPMFTPTGDVR